MCHWSKYFMHDIMQVHGVFIPLQTTRGASWHFWAYFGVRKLLVERKCDFFARCKAKNWHFPVETMHLGACIPQTPRTSHWHLRPYGWSNPSYDVKRANCGSWLWCGTKLICTDYQRRHFMEFRNFSAIYGLDYIIYRYLWRRWHEATA